MDSERFLARIDEHMARGNEHMARGNEHMERSNEHMARGNELLAAIRADSARYRAESERDLEITQKLVDEQIRVNRELFERSDAQIQITREVVRRNELAFKENSRILGEVLEGMREVRLDLRELGDEIRAQTRAIFTMLDRFEGGGEAPAGA